METNDTKPISVETPPIIVTKDCFLVIMKDGTVHIDNDRKESPIGAMIRFAKLKESIDAMPQVDFLYLAINMMMIDEIVQERYKREMDKE